MFADGRLTGVELFGCLGKTFRFVDGNEDLQVARFDDGSLTS
jgi:hypothetical protein